MAMTNQFDLLGEFDNDDPSQLIAAQLPKVASSEKKAPAPTQSAAGKQAKLPAKPLPPAQAVKEAKNETSRGGGRGGARGFERGRGGGGYNRDFSNNGNTFSNSNGYSGGYKPAEDGEAGQANENRGYGPPRGGYRGNRRGGFNNGDVADGERYRRPYERRSGTGRGNEIKRDGAGRANWGTATDDIALDAEEPPSNETEKVVEAEKLVQKDAVDGNKDSPVNETEEKEPEVKEMTLEEYEKVVDEKRKALLALKAEERKVVADKEFESMQMLSNKKSDEDIFVKLGSDKDKRKDAAEKEEKAKKSVSINEFLKQAERGYGGAGGRRGGRGRGSRDGFSGRNMMNNVAAPSIDDVAQFPSLCAK